MEYFFFSYFYIMYFLLLLYLVLRNVRKYIFKQKSLRNSQDSKGKYASQEKASHISVSMPLGNA